ncbi:helix-turn-helix domain-containing protein [Bradyrhizobium sp. SRL28]|uniref:helix-turn-helix domain-containing protein n=1 Tax=Bradyrhizobium sp. SRL28 TaxID=2836178 RepID=UPI001BDE27F4|nr:helix-turn-helix domain-containing protein [Bradyrhizobium sp. SRL28]MBT1512140.1 helix-turn-helix domain-containing protein [Bradyrhizobium sp. SRL28]
MAELDERQESAMPRVETIRGLERGLQVLRFLHSEPISSLHEIHAATAISKPSLLRILNTLERAGMVARRLADGRYRLSVFTDVVRKQDRYDRVAEAAAPVLARLCKKVKWPSDLFVPAGNCMERRETTVPHSPFVLPGLHGRVGGRVGWLMTGVGRAYLAWCPEKEREDTLRILRKSNNPEDWLARDPKKLERILSEARRRGYATRDPSYVAGRYGETPADDGAAAIAVALFDGRRVHGSINFRWIRTAFTVDDFAARHLADLQAAAREIVGSLQRPAR